MAEYYTPTIEEFHVGFEYWFSSAYQEGVSTTEITIDGRDGYEPMIFNFDVYNYTPNKGESWRDIFKSMLEHNQIKVKYLDKEDVGSLGWVVDSQAKNYFTYNENEYIALSFNPDDHSIVIWNGQDWDDEHIWFDGFVKNKSELKSLMSKLDIVWQG